MALRLSPGDEAILEAMTAGRDESEPWGFASPEWLVKQTDLSREYVSSRLTRFREHGVVSRPATGFYRLERDPREE